MDIDIIFYPQMYIKKVRSAEKCEQIAILILTYAPGALFIVRGSNSKAEC